MLQITKPYYQLNINSFCTTEVYVNDVLVDEWKGKETEGRERNSSLTPIITDIFNVCFFTIISEFFFKINFFTHDINNYK